MEEDTAKQVKTLTLCLSRETLAVVHNLGLSEAQIKKPSAIIEAMQKYEDRHINETMERYKFRHRTQQEGETFDDYLISLRDLAKTCKFCSDACIQKSIRDQIIEGLRDGDTAEDPFTGVRTNTYHHSCQMQEQRSGQEEPVTDGSSIARDQHGSNTL